MAFFNYKFQRIPARIYAALARHIFAERLVAGLVHSIRTGAHMEQNCCEITLGMIVEILYKLFLLLFLHRSGSTRFGRPVDV